MINNIIFPNLNINLTLNRAIFSIGSFDIYWYGVLIAIGLILAGIYAFHESKKTSLSEDDLFNMLLFAIPISIICARAYYVIFSFSEYKDNLAAIFNIRNGGLAVYGGIIGAVSVIFIYCKKKKIQIGIVLDILAIGLLIGQAIGRWGNFVNGEAFGSTTSLPWAMSIISNGKTIAESVHPTFLYESLWNIIGLIILIILKKKRTFNGETFCEYLIWYGTGRAIIESLRTDSLYLGFLRISQILSIVLILIGILVIYINKKKRVVK